MSARSNVAHHPSEGRPLDGALPLDSTAAAIDVRTVPTPNPNALMFRVDETLVPTGTFEYHTLDDAKASDVKVGSRVLFAPSSTSKTTATEVLVLPSKAKLGQEVSAVKPGTSISLKTLSGTQVIKTGDATYIKTTTGKRTNLVKGEKVVVKFFVVRGRRNQATDVVVLPNDTKFK